jgi:hypothetical protein
LVEAAKAMRMFKVRILFVGERDRLVGAVTDRDIAVRGIAQGLDPLTVEVRQIMTPAGSPSETPLNGANGPQGLNGRNPSAKPAFRFARARAQRHASFGSASGLRVRGFLFARARAQKLALSPEQ